MFDSRLSTAADPVRFYSYRRDKGRTGRHVTLAWLSPSRASQKP
ncbi:MAG: polyphenol oxidase family protein [Sutterellaceae bacterium]|nr:polyphenol oxidase family protein [Sutterellaceae bacterium]